MLSILRNSVAAAFAFSAFALAPASAETLPGALAKAYTNNSALNSARAGVRVTDENVPIAKSAMRPTIASQSGADYTWSSQAGTRLTTGSFGVEIQQTAVRRVSDQEQHADRRGEGEGGRRKPAQYRAEHPVQCGERVHGRHPRPQDRRAARAKPRVPGGAGASRPLALRGRRGYPHRRRPGRSQPLVCRRGARRGARPGAGQRRDLSPDRRRGTGQAEVGAGGQGIAQGSQFGGRHRQYRASGDRFDRASGRCGRFPGQVGGRLAAAAGFGVGGHFAQLPRQPPGLAFSPTTARSPPLPRG